MELYLCSLYIPSSHGQVQIYVLPLVGTRGAGNVGNFRVFCLSDLSVEGTTCERASGRRFSDFSLSSVKWSVPRCLLCILPDVAVVLFIPRTVNKFVQLCRKSKFHDSYLGVSYQLLMFHAFLTAQCPIFPKYPDHCTLPRPW